MRRSLSIVCAVAALLTLSLVPAASPALARSAAGDVEYGWPTTAVTVGETAYLNVTVTGHNEDLVVSMWDTTGYKYDLVAEGPVTVAAPSINLTIPTDAMGTYEYEVQVETADNEAYVDSTSHDVEVLGFPTTITTADLPSGTFKTGGNAPITGVVTGTPGRAVQVQAKSETGWTTVGRTVTDASGAFSLNAPTWWVNTSVLRVAAPATDAYEAGVGTDTSKITVKRSYKPLGGTAYSFLNGTRKPDRWNPCQEITYRLNPRRAPRHGIADVAEAFRRVSEATGLSFRYVGKTDFVPWRNGNQKRQVKNAEIGIAWANERLVPDLGGGVIGLGGYSSGWTDHSIKGGVVLDTKTSTVPGFKEGAYTNGSVLMHEIAHVIGLGHVSDRRQIMYHSVQRTSRFGSGDLLGMSKVGAMAGCFEKPSNRAASRLALAPMVPHA